MGQRLFDLSEFAELYTDHKLQSQEMAARLQKIGLPSFEARGARMMNCNSIVGGQLCPICKRFHTTNASLCRDRLCPNCGWTLAHKRALAMFDAITELSEQHDIAVIHVVLTVRHDSAAEHFEASVASLNEGLQRFTSIMKRQKRFRCMLGSVISLEMLNDSHGLHPHAHMLWIVDRKYFDDPVTQDELCKLWRSALRVDYKPITYIKLAYDKDGAGDFRSAVYECVKYNIKTADLLSLPSYRLAVFAQAVHRLQMFRLSGKPLKEAFKHALEMHRESELSNCDKCGGDLYDVVLTANDLQEARIHE